MRHDAIFLFVVVVVVVVETCMFRCARLCDYLLITELPGAPSNVGRSDNKSPFNEREKTVLAAFGVGCVCYLRLSSFNT